MPSLGIGQTLTKSSLVTPGVIRDNLVLKHNYNKDVVEYPSDGAAYFARSNTDYIAISETTLSVHDTAYSFAFWVNLTSIGDWHPIFGDDDDSPSIHNMIAIDQENDRFIIEGSDGDNIQWNTLQDPLVLGTWNHFALCLDGSGSAKAYQNGVELTMTADTIGSDFTFKYIGKLASEYLDGYLCNVAYWSSQLTQAQVKSIMWKNYTNLTALEKKFLISWWSLDYNIASTIVDFHGTNHGTLS